MNKFLLLFSKMKYIGMVSADEAEYYYFSIDEDYPHKTIDDIITQSYHLISRYAKRKGWKFADEITKNDLIFESPEEGPDLIIYTREYEETDFGTRTEPQEEF